MADETAKTANTAPAAAVAHRFCQGRGENLMASNSWFALRHAKWNHKLERDGDRDGFSGARFGQRAK
jgi:hypothetical protein